MPLRHRSAEARERGHVGGQAELLRHPGDDPLDVLAAPVALDEQPAHELGDELDRREGEDAGLGLRRAGSRYGRRPLSRGGDDCCAFGRRRTAARDERDNRVGQAPPRFGAGRLGRGADPNLHLPEI